MSIFRALTDDPHIGAALRQASREGRMAIVRAARADAVARLAAAVERVPRVPDRIAQRYRSMGLAPRWNLANDDEAVEFVLTLSQHGPSVLERAAAALLRACVAAEEAGDVLPLADEALGVATRGANRARRKGKPADDPRDTGRDDRLRAYHARLRADGAHDPTSATAAEFGLSTRRVREILKG